MSGGGAYWRLREAALLFGVALVLCVVAWMLGFAVSLRTVQPSPPVPAGVQAPPNWPLFGEAWGYVDREFYGAAPTGRAVTQGAIEGLLATVDDPYAALIPAGSEPDGDGELAAVLVGRVGAWIQSVSAGAQILSVLPDSPASRASLMPGDVVLGADQQVVAGKRLPELAAALGATTAPTVTLVVRDKAGAGRVAELTRGAFPSPQAAVKWLSMNVLWVSLPALDTDTVAAMDSALDAAGGGTPGSLVLDLRDNPGGTLEVARQLAGRMTDGTLFVQVARDGTQTPQPVAAAEGGQASLRAPRFYVLVNGGTAAEAEMLAGALRDNARAELIGQTTFGKGTVQEALRLADGSLVRLTTAYWLTPDGAKVDGVGLKPAKAVEGREAQAQAATAAALESGGG